MLPFLVGLIMAGQPLPFETLVAPRDPKEVWLHALAQCESQGSTTIKVWDSNNKWSIGKYQYQYATWAKYSKLFGTTRENITDGDLQDKVTRYILDNGGEDNWYTCSRIVQRDIGPYPLLPNTLSSSARRSALD